MEEPSTKYAVIPHMGLGDQIVLKGLIAKLTEVAEEVLLFGKKAYQQSLIDIYADLPNVFLALVEDAHVVSPVYGADGRAWKQLEDKGYTVLPLGYHTGSPSWLTYDPLWSKCLYKSLGLHPSVMYDGFSIKRNAAVNDIMLQKVIMTLGPKFVVVHDDPLREMVLDPAWLPPGLPVIHVDDPAIRSTNITDYCDLIEHATEFHGIDSCFALLADFLCPPGTGPKRHVHVTSARLDTLPGLYRGTTLHHHDSVLSTPDGKNLAM